MRWVFIGIGKEVRYINTTEKSVAMGEFSTNYRAEILAVIEATKIV